MNPQPLRRITPPTLLALDALLRGDRYGRAIHRSTGVRSGSLYPILRRLEALGWVASEWETPAPEGRPRRRYYDITPEGRTAAVTLLQQRRSAGP